MLRIDFLLLDCSGTVSIFNNNSMHSMMLVSQQRNWLLRSRSTAGSSPHQSFVLARRYLAAGGRPPAPRVPPPPKAAAAAPTTTTPKAPLPPVVTPSAAGSGRGHGGMSDPLYQMSKTRTPVTWTSLFLVGVAAASVVAYYRIERERRLEQAMGKIVSSESTGWTPKPDVLGRRQFVQTASGQYVPRDDGWGARE